MNSQPPILYCLARCGRPAALPEPVGLCAPCATVVLRIAGQRPDLIHPPTPLRQP